MRWTMGRRSDNVEDRRGIGAAAAADRRAAASAASSSCSWPSTSASIPASCSRVAASPLRRRRRRQRPARGADDEIKQFVVGRARRHRGHLDASCSAGSDRDYQRADAGALLRRGPVGLRHRPAPPSGRSTAPPTSKRLYRPVLLPTTSSDRFGAPGDFAQAYVIAHEVGHHVQNLLGISGHGADDPRPQRRRREANALSVRIELQADCFAGVWAHHATATRQSSSRATSRKRSTPPPPSATTACRSSAEGRVVPESFTHGTSAQRVHGSAAASTPAKSASATPSPPAARNSSSPPVRRDARCRRGSDA